MNRNESTNGDGSWAWPGLFCIEEECKQTRREGKNKKISELVEPHEAQPKVKF